MVAQQPRHGIRAVLAARHRRRRAVLALHLGDGDLVFRQLQPMARVLLGALDLRAVSSPLEMGSSPLMPCATSPSAMPFTSSTCRPRKTAICSNERDVFSTSQTAVALGISGFWRLMTNLSLEPGREGFPVRADIQSVCGDRLLIAQASPGAQQDGIGVPMEWARSADVAVHDKSLGVRHSCNVVQDRGRNAGPARGSVIEALSDSSCCSATFNRLFLRRGMNAFRSKGMRMKAIGRQGYYFDDLEMGMEGSLTKTVSAADTLAFAATTGDWNPVHLDADYAAKTVFKEPIARGC